MKPFEFVAKSWGREGSEAGVPGWYSNGSSFLPTWGAVSTVRGWGVGASWGLGVGGSHLPDTRLLAVHHRHVAGLAIFDELLLCLVELLGHEAHEGVVWGVSCSQTTRSGRGMPWFT